MDISELYDGEDREIQVIAYLRVSTDLQDIGKQRDTLKHHARIKGLKITRFVEIDMLSLEGYIGIPI